MKHIQGGLCAPQGYTAAGVNATIKPTSKKRDCTLIVSDRVAEVAAQASRG